MKKYKYKFIGEAGKDIYVNGVCYRVYSSDIIELPVPVNHKFFIPVGKSKKREVISYESKIK